MAAKAPRTCITTPILGIKTASTNVKPNHVKDTAIRWIFSWATICSGVRRQAVFQIQPKAALLEFQVVQVNETYISNKRIHYYQKQQKIVLQQKNKKNKHQPSTEEKDRVSGVCLHSNQYHCNQHRCIWFKWQQNVTCDSVTKHEISKSCCHSVCQHTKDHGQGNRFWELTKTTLFHAGVDWNDTDMTLKKNPCT